MKSKFKVLQYIFLFCLSLSTFAQTTQANKENTIKISGIVKDNNGEPLIGATIIVFGSSKGVTTDSNGKFTIDSPIDKMLKISYIGFKEKLLKAENKFLEVVLDENVNEISDVVVIGYGTVKKSDLTGSVTSLKTDFISNNPSTRVDQMLQGRVAGAEVVSTNGEPGAATSIRIRGSRSISASNEPLYDVDGVMEGISNINELNPNDIKSIEVLKDASSTAIYGSRGSNGVIIITTKQVAIGKMKFSFTTEIGFSQIKSHLDLLNATEYALYRNDYYAFLNSQSGVTLEPVVGNSQKTLEEYPEVYGTSGGYSDPLSYGEGTDWVKEITRIAPYQSYNFNASGGDRLTTYYLSLSYMDNEGIIKNSGLKRIQGRFNMTKTISKYVRSGISINYSAINNNVNKVGIGSDLTYSNSPISLAPTLAAYLPDGSFNNWSPFANATTGGPIDLPNARVALESYNKLSSSLFSRLYVEVLPIIDLSIKSSISYTLNDNTTNRFQPSSLATRTYNNSGAYAFKSSSTGNNMLLENTISYKKSISEHSIDGLYGFTLQAKNSENFSLSGSGYLVDDIGVNDLGSIPDKESLTAASGYTQQNMVSHLARINYNYDRRYYITLSGRYDGASNFAQNHKWAFFPSVAMKWNIVKEAFMKNNRVFNDLSLRLSAGTVGNQAINPYASLSQLTSNTSGYIFDGKQPAAFVPVNVYNSSLTWEKTQNLNLGLDVSLLNNRIVINFDAYKTVTSDLLLYKEIPTQAGYSTRLDNYGQTSNLGAEFMITSNNITKRNFGWSTTFTISTNKQIVDNIGGTDDLVPAYSYTEAGVNYPMYGYKKGYPLNAIWGLKSAGIWHSKEEVMQNLQEKKYVSLTGTLSSPYTYYRNGYPRYVDKNRDGKLDYLTDLFYLGDSDPDFYGGIQNNFKLYGFELGIYFSYSVGGRIYLPTAIEMGSSHPIRNQYGYARDRYHPIRNPNSDIPAAGASDHLPSDKDVYDASFLRLKNTSLSYKFNLSKVTKNKLESLILTANGTNLFLLKNYLGYDPEVSNQSSGSTIRRMDNGAYPPARMIVFSVQCSF